MRNTRQFLLFILFVIRLFTQTDIKTRGSTKAQDVFEVRISCWVIWVEELSLSVKAGYHLDDTVLLIFDNILSK